MDGSGSIGQKSFEKSKDVIKKLLQVFPHEEGNRHATVVYGGKSWIVFNNIRKRSKYQKTSELVGLVNRIPYNNAPLTRTDKALNTIHQEIFPKHIKFRDYRPKVIKKILHEIILQPDFSIKPFLTWTIQYIVLPKIILLFF